jgi:hypothetical protein
MLLREAEAVRLRSLRRHRRISAEGFPPYGAAARVRAGDRPSRG